MSIFIHTLVEILCILFLNSLPAEKAD